MLALGELAVHELDVAHERSVVGRSGAGGGEEEQAGLELDDGPPRPGGRTVVPVRCLLPQRLHPIGDPARVAAWHGDALRGAPHLGARQNLIESAEVVDAAAEHAARDVDEPGLDEERRQPARQALDDRVRTRAVSLGEAADGGVQRRRKVFAQDGAAVGRPQAGCLGLPFVEHDLNGAVAGGGQRRARERLARGVRHLHPQAPRVRLREVQIGAADREGEAAVGVGAGPAREHPPPLTCQLDPRPAQPLAGIRDDASVDLEAAHGTCSKLRMGPEC